MSYLDPVINPTEDEFNAWLSTQTLRGNTNSRRLSDLLNQEQLAAMQADNAMGGDPGVQFAAPQEQRLNTIRSSSGRTIDLGYAAPGGSGVAPDGRRVKSDPWVDGPRVLSRKQLADGTIEVIKEAPALDGFGRQSSKIVREIETPDYLNPAMLKKAQYEKAVGEARKANREANAMPEPKLVDGQWVYPPSQANPQGQAVPVGGLKKNPTEDERKTAYNVGRILQSAKMIQNTTEGKGGAGAMSPGFLEATAGVLPLWDTAQEGAKNLARDKNRQIVYQSQADIIDSLLFLATGAAYNKEQLAQQRSSYLPNFTDEPEAINAKNERMKGLIEAAKVRAAHAWTPEMESALSVLNIPAVGGGNKPQPTQQPKQTLNIPDSASAYLKKNPYLRKQFDLKYGEGASQQVLGQ